MIRKFTFALVAIVMLAAALAFSQVASKPAAAPASKGTVALRTTDGQPDLQGVWSTATTVPLERPANLGAKEFYTPEELAANAARAGQRKGKAAPREDGALAVHYDLSQFALNRREIAPSLRTSLIVGPEGRIPPTTDAAKQRAAAAAAIRRDHGFDGPENRGLAERCILWGSEGPPMMAAGYNDNLQIVQGPGYVAILQEMIHDTRMIPTDGSAHPDKNVKLWFGDSRGHWEGNTLVVDTANFNGRAAWRGSSENLHVTERFTRKDAETLTYQFTVEDPATWTQPWSAEVSWVKSANDRIFEYACQEGNYGMANILSGVRATEAKQAAGAK
ncbi:MAG TPA: hypothetical protein VN841_27475 [Bryobacteraceae bacterium]|nr:hypothetical protein [Bryobacteraceae bacterium]